MKIVFIVSSTYSGERLGVQILISIAKGEGFDCSFYPLDLMQEEGLLRQIEDIKPEVVAYSAMAYEHLALQDFNKKLKERFSFISIFGGPYYTFCPEEIDSDKHVDVVCVGEGEIAFRTFLKHVKNKTAYTGVSNLFVRQNGVVYKNPVGPLIANLDEVPFTDRKTVSLNKKGNRYLGRTRSVQVSRGCPYLCTYCFNSTYNKIYRAVSPQKLRWRSVPNVIAEMKKIKQEEDIDYFTLADDTFNALPKDYIHEFCRRYKKEITLPLFISLRANLVDEDIIKALKEAGLDSVNCAIECGDEEVSKNILKRGQSNEQVLRAFRVFNKYGIKTIAQNIIGLPVEDTVENAFRTIKFNIENSVTHANFSLLLPLPKTPMEQYCKEHGYLYESNNRHNLSPSAFTKSMLRFRTREDKCKVENLHKFASIVVRYPSVLPLVKWLIRLPPNRSFDYICFIWHGYANTVLLHGVRWNLGLVISGIRQISSYLQRHN